MKVHLPQSRKLALTPELYSSIVKHGSDLITVLDGDGTYLYASDSITKILGYQPEDLLGTDVRALIHPEDLPIVQDCFLDLVYGENMQVNVPPFRYKNKNGSWHWLSCVATNMFGNPDVQGIVTNSRDITNKMDALQQKRESEAYYRALYFNNPDPVITLNPMGQVEASNEAVEGVTGYSREETNSIHFTEYVLPEYRQEAMQFFLEAMAGHPRTFETCILHKEGHKKHLSITVLPVVVEGQVRAVQCIAKDTTSVKRANMLVQEHAQKLNNILESITEAFFALDSNWCYSFGNTAFVQWLKRDIDDLMRRCIWEEYPTLLGSLFYQKCHEVVATSKSVTFYEYIASHDATLRFCINPYDGGVSVSFTDISSQLRVQEELRKLSLVASKTTNGVIITDADGTIEWVNEAFAQLSGYTLEEVAGVRPGKILADSNLDPSEVSYIRQQLAEGKPVRRELQGNKRSGERFWSDVSITPVKNEFGEVTNHVYIHADITDRKLDQEQLLKTAERLYLQNQDLQQFNYIVSHNLRAPVANLVGLATMLQKMDRSGSRFDLGLQNLEKSARRLDDVINDLNKILAVRAANKDDSREIVSLKEVASEVLQSLQHLLDLAGAQLVTDLSADDILWGNRAYVYSILHNLITNAIKYKSTDRNLLIELISVRKENELILQVRDNGSGMNLEAVQPHLFQLYKRFHTGQEGKGIGLYLVKMQVEAIGGRITVESQVEAGTTFTLHFEKASHGQQGLHN